MMIPPYPGDPILEEVNIEMGNDKEFQLYNLKKDIGQKNNLAKAQTKKLKELMKNFELIRGNSYNNVEKIELK